MNVTPELPRTRPLPAGHEEVLRQVLLAEIAAPAAAPRPRTRRKLVASLAAAAAASVAAVGALNLAGASTAYASWTAVPDQVDAAAARTLGHECAQQQQAHFRNTAASAPVVAERRGHFTAVLMSGADMLSACVSVRGGALGAQTQLTTMPVGAQLAMDGDPGVLNGPDAFRVAYGRVSSDVTSVTVRTQDGRRVTASISNGFFLCWWPSGAAPAGITATDASGHNLGELRYTAPPTTPPVPSHR